MYIYIYIYVSNMYISISLFERAFFKHLKVERGIPKIIILFSNVYEKQSNKIHLLIYTK